MPTLPNQSKNRRFEGRCLTFSPLAAERNKVLRSFVLREGAQELMWRNWQSPNRVRNPRVTKTLSPGFPIRYTHITEFLIASASVRPGARCRRRHPLMVGNYRGGAACKRKCSTFGSKKRQRKSYARRFQPGVTVVEEEALEALLSLETKAPKESPCTPFGAVWQQPVG